MEDAAEVTNNNIRGHAMTTGPGLQAASNGSSLMPRPASGSAASASMSSKAHRGAASGDLDNYSDIRPDILEMIKEEQKVGWRMILIILLHF